MYDVVLPWDSKSSRIYETSLRMVVFVQGFKIDEETLFLDFVNDTAVV